MKNFILVFFLISMTSFAQTTKQKANTVSANATPVQVPQTQEGYQTAYFASGCFWCSEAIYESVIGVKKVVPGYSGGQGKNPTYETYAEKGHAETVEVTYDPKVIDFSSLLTVYFNSQNVTQQNGQGPDFGFGYRSIVFYQNAREKKIIEQKIKDVQKHYSKPVAAKVVPFQKFWVGEDYHKNFEKKHPNNPYIRQVSIPRLLQFQAKYPELIKEERQH